MKAGIVEIPHLIVVTKADLGAAAERARADVAGALSLATAAGAWPLKTLAISSRSGTGIDQLMDALEAHRLHLQAVGRLAICRHRQSEGWLREALQNASAREGRATGRAWLDASLPAGTRYLRLRELTDALRSRDDLDRRQLRLLQIVAGQCRASGCWRMTQPSLQTSTRQSHALAVAKGHWPIGRCHNARCPAARTAQQSRAR